MVKKFLGNVSMKKKKNDSESVYSSWNKVRIEENFGAVEIFLLFFFFFKVVACIS